MNKLSAVLESRTRARDRLEYFAADGPRTGLVALGLILAADVLVALGRAGLVVAAVALPL